MQTEVNPRETAETSPEEQRPIHRRAAEIEREEGPGAKGVGGVATDEAVEPSPQVTDQVHIAFQRWLVAGAETMEERFTESAGKAVGQEDDEGKAGYDEQHLAPGTILQQDIEQNKNERNPGTSSRDGQETMVLAVCNKLTRELKLAKVYVDQTFKNVTATCEFFYANNEALEQNLRNSLQMLGVVRTVFRKDLAELSED